ncbi:MAG TPA: zf-HC2 domain-containing protein [Egibacteraceae bacterium]
MADSCDDLEPLGSAWLDGALDPPQAAAFAAHLQVCEDCRREIDDLARTRALLRSLPVRRMPRELLEEVPLDASDPLVDSEPAATGLPAAAAAARPRGRTMRTAIAVAVLGILGGAAFSLGDRPPEARTVAVPMDLFVADHVAQSRRAPVWSPVMVEALP